MTMLPMITRSIPSVSPQQSPAKPCLNVRCNHGASRHAVSTNGRRRECLVPGCWCRRYQTAEPFSDRVWVENLWRLRATGKRRGQQGLPSRSLMPLLNALPDQAVIVDIGCGDSGDRTVAKQLGLIAHGVDLFPPFQPILHDGFVQADALSLPFRTASIDGVVLHAVTSLIKPSDRPLLYSEIARVLKPRGLFSMMLYWLADGYYLTNHEEDSHIRKSGFYRKQSGQLYSRK